MPKRVSVVILTWNNLEHLKQFLPLLLERTQDDNVEIIIADNHSKDHTTTWVADHYPGIRLLAFKKNLGYAGGYAAALSQIHSEFFLLLNSDVEVLPGWLPPLVEVMEDTDVAAVMPKILSKKDPRYFEYAGAAGGWIDRYGYPFCRGRIFNTLEKDTHQYDQITPVFWASGACMLVRRESFLAAGGFDPDFFAHMEEIDLCWRFQKRGLKVLYQPHSTVLHVGGGSLPNEHPYKIFLNFRNNLLLLYKNLPLKQRKRVIRARRILDGIAALQFLLTGKPAYLIQVIRAHRQFGKMKTKYHRSADESSNQQSPDKLKGYYAGSVVFQYFIRRKKRFSDLKNYR